METKQIKTSHIHIKSTSYTNILMAHKHTQSHFVVWLKQMRETEREMSMNVTVFVALKMEYENGVSTKL